MTKRHWPRDVIDFSDCGLGYMFGCRSDTCGACNDAAKEIADSIALYGLPSDSSTVDDLATQPNGLDRMARNECNGLY